MISKVLVVAVLVSGFRYLALRCCDAGSRPLSIIISQSSIDGPANHILVAS